MADNIENEHNPTDVIQKSEQNSSTPSASKPTQSDSPETVALIQPASVQLTEPSSTSAGLVDLPRPTSTDSAVLKETTDVGENIVPEWSIGILVLNDCSVNCNTIAITVQSVLVFQH